MSGRERGESYQRIEQRDHGRRSERQMPQERKISSDVSVKELFSKTEVKEDISSEDALKIRVDTTLEQLGGHHNLLGGTANSRRAEIIRLTIRPEDVPERYFAHQHRLRYEKGYGLQEFNQQQRDALANNVSVNKYICLEEWVDYFNDQTTTYPDTFRYFTLRSILSLGNYDPDKKAYLKRSKGTTALYPILNKEALEMVYHQLYEEDVEFPSDERFLDLLKPLTFGRLYAKAQEEVILGESSEYRETSGSWYHFPQLSEGENDSLGREIAAFIRGKMTGWCILNAHTAGMFLRHGDMYLYASDDKSGKPTIPRIAISMKGEQVGEVSGILKNQHVESELDDVLSGQLEKIPGGELYKRRTSDMERVTALEKKQSEGESFTRDDLLFLYQVRRPIRGFGDTDDAWHSSRDPRIKILLGYRDITSDATSLFNFDSQEIATSERDMHAETKLFLGDYMTTEQGSPPDDLRVIIGDAFLYQEDLKNIQYISGDTLLRDLSSEVDLQKLTYIGGDVFLQTSHITDGLRERLDEITKGHVFVFLE